MVPPILFDRNVVFYFNRNKQIVEFVENSLSKIFLNIINLFLIRKKSLIIIIVASLLIAAIEYIFVFYGIIDFGQKLETLEQNILLMFLFLWYKIIFNNCFSKI